MSTTSYKDYEGDVFQIKLKKGLSSIEIEAIKDQIPNGNLGVEMEEILRYSRGLEIPKGFLSVITFDDFGIYGFEELIQFSLTIADDSSGNYWIQEINKKGEWGKVYYVCHDPPVMVKQAESLSAFLHQLHEYLLKGEASFFSKVMEEISEKIYLEKGKLLEQAEAVKSTDKRLSTFAANYNKDWFIADLRQAKDGEGFRLEGAFKETIRLEEELIWALKKHKSFWTRLKEKFK